MTPQLFLERLLFYTPDDPPGYISGLSHSLAIILAFQLGFGKSGLLLTFPCSQKDSLDHITVNISSFFHFFCGLFFLRSNSMFTICITKTEIVGSFPTYFNLPKAPNPIIISLHLLAFLGSWLIFLQHESVVKNLCHQNGQLLCKTKKGFGLL